ncbi:MAG: hypothetical protein IJM54_09215, partial [Thermoguttaceae bacterium]|nr:hypothetical protein [Thermoguttaceae bacterium]
IEDNAYSGNGGAVFNCVDATFNNVVMDGNIAENIGGAVYNHEGSLTVRGESTFKNNTAVNGGDVYNKAGLSVDTLTAPSGVYIANSATFTFSQRAEIGSLFVGNSATVTFSGVDSVLAATTTASIGSATFTAAEGSNGFLVVPNLFDLSKATIGPNITVYDVSKFENRYKYRFLNWDNTNWTLPNWY